MVLGDPNDIVDVMVLTANMNHQTAVSTIRPTVLCGGRDESSPGARYVHPAHAEVPPSSARPARSAIGQITTLLTLVDADPRPVYDGRVDRVA
jgi:hypothetical protein